MENALSQEFKNFNVYSDATFVQRLLLRPPRAAAALEATHTSRAALRPGTAAVVKNQPDWIVIP